MLENKIDKYLKKKLKFSKSNLKLKLKPENMKMEPLNKTQRKIFNTNTSVNARLEIIKERHDEIKTEEILDILNKEKIFKENNFSILDFLENYNSLKKL